MDKDNLMTVQEFNLQVTKWAMKVRRAAKQTLATQTHSSGQLAFHLAQFIDKLGSQEPAYKVKFQFGRYGVFRAYGAGRGYVIVNGQIMRGVRVRSEREIKLKVFNAVASRYVQKGFTTKQVNRLKLYETGNDSIVRHPLDWIDIHIEQSIGNLADNVQEYYGDEAVRQIAESFGKMKIVKK